MADDVISAPLPGLPEPSAVEPTSASAAAPTATPRGFARRERARRSAYRFRFAIVYIVLAALVGGAVGAFVVILNRPDAPPGQQWSSWQPTGSNDAKGKQIADHVSRRYRLPSGNELAVAIVGPPQATSSDGASIPVTAIAVRPDTSKGLAEENDVHVAGANGSLMFVLCGLGTGCSISEGTASEARHQLLRREALELALYTFKYVDSVSSVVAFLPPRPDANVGTAVFISRADVADELRLPLSATLETTVPPPLGAIPAKEAGTIDRITLSRVYQYGFTQAQNGAGILVLDPVVTTAP